MGKALHFALMIAFFGFMMSKAPSKEASSEVRHSAESAQPLQPPAISPSFLGKVPLKEKLTRHYKNIFFSKRRVSAVSLLRSPASLPSSQEHQWLVRKKLIEPASVQVQNVASLELARGFLWDKSFDLKLTQFRANDLLSIRPEANSQLEQLLNSRRTGVFSFQKQSLVGVHNAPPLQRNLVFCELGVKAGSSPPPAKFERGYISDLLRIQKVSRIPSPYPRYQGIRIKTTHLSKVHLGTYISFIQCFYPSTIAQDQSYRSMEFLDMLFSLNARGYYHRR